MSVESKNSKLAQKPNGDKKSTGISDRRSQVPAELKDIANVLAQRRIMRDTTNHPSVELARTARMGAVKRRLAKTGSPKISDSGSPDDGGGDATDGFSSDTGAATA